MIDAIRSIGKLTILKLIGALIGLTYAVLQVRYFGATGIVDAFFVAFAALQLITSLTQGGQIAEVLLPEYIKEKEKHGMAAASAFFSTVLNRVVLILAAILILFYFMAPWIIAILGAGLDQSLQAFSISLFRASLILILFNIIASFVNAVLNAEQVYGRAEVTGLVNSSISVLLLMLLYESLGIWVLVYSLLVGKLIEFIIGVYFLRKTGFSYHLRLRGGEYPFGKFFSVLLSTSSYVGATQVFSVVLTSLSSYLPEGTLSLFNYTKQLASKAKSIILSPVATVFFSKFSLKVAQGKERLNDYLELPFFGLWWIAIVNLCFVAVVGESVLGLLWQSDSLSAADYQLAYGMLLLNMLGIGFSMIGTLFRKSAVALGAAQRLYQLWTLAQLACAGYSYLIIKAEGAWGLATIPLCNMLLLSLISMIVAHNHGIKIADIIRHSKYLRAQVFFILLAAMATASLYSFDMQAYGQLSEVIFKTAALALFFLFVVLLLMRKELRALYLNFKGT